MISMNILDQQTWDFTLSLITTNTNYKSGYHIDPFCYDLKNDFQKNMGDLLDFIKIKKLHIYVERVYLFKRC